MHITKRLALVIAAFVLFITTVTCLRRYNVHEILLSSPGVDGKRERVPDKNHERGEDDLFCAVMNPTSGTYIDLSQLSSTPNNPKDADRRKRGKKRNSDPSKTRWLVSGWSYDTNFTLGICSSPVTKDEESQLSNTTGAFYVDHKRKEDHQLVSIGDFGTRPMWLKSKKLTLKYENGSMCPNGVDRKATLLNFVCDKEISTKAQITYIGSLHDCSYFFEVRSIYACPTSNKSKEVNVLGIFIGIFAVFFLVEYGGRRWLYGKMRNHFNPQGVTARRPRWEFSENQPRWKRTLKSFTRWISSMLSNGTHNQGPITLGPSSIPSNRSQDSFLRDVERQNNIIDSLDVTTQETVDDDNSGSVPSL